MIERARNQIAFILIDGRNGERTIIWDRDERLAYKVADAPMEIATRGRILHLDAHDPRACIPMAKAANEAGSSSHPISTMPMTDCSRCCRSSTF